MGEGTRKSGEPRSKLAGRLGSWRARHVSGGGGGGGGQVLAPTHRGTFEEAQAKRQGCEDALTTRREPEDAQQGSWEPGSSHVLVGRPLKVAQLPSWNDGTCCAWRWYLPARLAVWSQDAGGPVPSGRFFQVPARQTKRGRGSHPLQKQVQTSSSNTTRSRYPFHDIAVLHRLCVLLLRLQMHHLTSPLSCSYANCSVAPAAGFYHLLSLSYHWPRRLILNAPLAQTRSPQPRLSAPPTPLAKLTCTSMQTRRYLAPCQRHWLATPHTPLYHARTWTRCETLLSPACRRRKSRKIFRTILLLKNLSLI